MSTSQSTHQAMNRLGDSQRRLTAPQSARAGSYWSWLLFKEAKQLAPLVIALCACGLVLHLLGCFVREGGRADVHSGALLMVPLLFAIGAGPMLVSQEKEQRTLSWMGSLPIGPRSIVLSKLIVCVMGLVLSWVVSLAFTSAMAPSFFNSWSFGKIDLLYWVSGTFALLSTGLSLAWVFSTAISSLIALAVTSFVMTILGRIVLSGLIYNETHDRLFEIVGLGAFGLLVSLAAVFCGQRAFVTGAATESTFSWRRWQRRRLSQQVHPTLWTQSPSSSLIWQISRQNNFLWSGLLLIAVMSGCLFLCFTLNNPSEADLFLSVLLPVGLALSWLGASVFGSDSYRDRINFLAQRGVAPGLIWWTRMILPLGSVALFGLLILSFGHLGLGTQTAPHWFVWGGVVGVLMIFAFTQWFSQWTRSTLIGFCVAPAVAAMVIGYQGFVIQFLQAPLWVLLPSIAVAMLATRLMLCPWMDGRFDLRYWAGHGGLLLLALGIPLMPFLYTWATYPDMSSAMKYSLAAEAEEYRQSPRPAVVDLLSNRREVPTDDAKAEPKGIAQSISDILDSMEQELSAIKGPIRVPGNRIAIKSADLLSLRMDAAVESEDLSDRAQNDRQSYRRVMLLLDDQVRHLRLSERLQEQDYADALERWLVSELSRPGRREIFTDQQYAHIVAGLADQDARHQARRRAIVMAWHESTVQRKHQFRNDAAIKKKVILAPRWLVARRDAAMAAEDLLKRLESSVPRQLTYPGELYSLSLRAVPPPGLLWHRPWEAKAKQLAESLKSTPAIKGADDE